MQNTEHLSELSPRQDTEAIQITAIINTTSSALLPGQGETLRKFVILVK